ncbi:hypothetical protein [Nocardiopsis dassonvillei]|uniref:hypothetical protein n=1 Tax=Nocardiopsis dassonvillei TaxID=2014 RepID=UPI00363BC747
MALLLPRSRPRRRPASPSHPRSYAAEELRAGMIVADPDGRLGLRTAQVRVAADARPLDRYDTTQSLIDYDVPGTTATGRLRVDRLAPVWVVGGDR